jgi:hypothetical protein
MNKLQNFFYNQPKRRNIHKWEHYFEIYDKHFKKFQGKNPKILEIGIYKGGSIDMWNYYFDKNCTIYAVDIDPSCKEYSEENVHISIGDQGSSDFWKSFLINGISFDIIIDDGGHTMHQQIYSYEILYKNHLNDGGVYLCEDTHTSYLSFFGGELGKKGTFIEYCKDFIDLLHVYYNKIEHSSICGFEVKESNLTTDFRKMTQCVSFYDSVVVLDKKIDNKLPSSVMMS